MRVGILGGGLQGYRRAKAIQDCGDEIVAISDIDNTKRELFAVEFKCEGILDWRDLTTRNDVDIIVVCTPNYLHASMCIEALRNKKHVLCEKPLATTVEQALRMVEVSKQTGMKLKCGFNLRYHPGIQKAKEWIDNGAIGKLMYTRLRYGMTGRPGYDLEWRAKPEFSGGGELMDQGVHALDLSRWVLGEFSEVCCFLSTSYWTKSDVEDNAFCMLRTKDKKIANIHISWTQWKNLFSFELFGNDGYIVVEGLGGSYGTERAMLGKRDFTKPFSEKVVEFRGNDVSWSLEWKDFISSIHENKDSLSLAIDGLETVKLVHALYQSASEKRVVFINND